MSYYNRRLNVGFIWTMNAPGDYYETGIKPSLAATESTAAMFFHGDVKSYASLDTLQVRDYSKFAMRAFNEAAKKERHDRQFPIDLQECFNMGKDLSK